VTGLDLFYTFSAGSDAFDRNIYHECKQYVEPCLYYFRPRVIRASDGPLLYQKGLYSFVFEALAGQVQLVS